MRSPFPTANHVTYANVAVQNGIIFYLTSIRVSRKVVIVLNGGTHMVANEKRKKKAKKAKREVQYAVFN